MRDEQAAAPGALSLAFTGVREPVAVARGGAILEARRWMKARLLPKLQE